MSEMVMLNTIMHFFHSPGNYVMPAKHSGTELMFYRDGSGTTIIDGVLYEYSPNSLAVISPNTVHDETTGTPSEVFFCIFYEERVSLLLRELLIVIRRLEDQRTDSRGIIDYVKRMLKEDPGRNVDFHIIAESVGYSYDRFRHLFRDQTGVSPAQYLLTLRIASAKKLLENEALPLSRVGMLCGFQNVSNFVTMFHKKVRVTPMQYRKMIRENPGLDVLTLAGEEDL